MNGARSIQKRYWSDDRLSCAVEVKSAGIRTSRSIGLHGSARRCTPSPRELQLLKASMKRPETLPVDTTPTFDSRERPAASPPR
jgi:hypothetical protein